MNAIQTKQLVKIFGGVNAVDHLSVSVPKGEIVGIVGPNGSGKTTLINVLTGVHEINGGSVVIGGEKEKHAIRPHDVFSLGITRTFQNIRLFEQVSVMDNVLISVTARSPWRALFEKHRTFHENQAKEVLEKVGLWEKRHANASELSYGQRKLLEIARALATGADTILFDEPFAGLFPEMVKLVSGIMKELRAGEKTVVLIEHDMAIIRELCDRVIVMDAGKLLAVGKPEDVLKDSKVIEAYLGV
jgi:branched-chain amino acid transport system ATP-binding protein